MSHFFIDRIRFAIVISLVIAIVGAIALQLLPIQQYPNITPPTINVTAIYPGADAATIAEVVASPIETAVNSVDDMVYMTSTSSNAGFYSLTVTFEVGTDPDLAQVKVQNALQTAMSRLPTEVQQQGVTVGKRSPDFLLAIAIVSPDGSMSDLEIANYTATRLIDPLVRVDGVGEASTIGTSEYSMRIWLDQPRMEKLSITPTDVSSAVRRQNIQASLGTVGAAPAAEGVELQYTIIGEGRLSTRKAFENIVIREGADGAIIRLSDIARIELGAQSYDASARVGTLEATMIQVNQAPGGNALTTRDAVIETLDRLAESFPAGLEYRIIYDATNFVSSSISLILRILIEAFVIVIAVVFLFLQDWRATIVTAIAIPVSLLGALAVLLMLGYSINTISLLALVLAIGLVVDDAILVVENLQRVMQEEPELSNRDAAKRSMDQISAPIISTTLVLLAVVAPTAFLPGINGQLYRQFAVTVGSALVVSSIVALTLSPALAAVLMRKPVKDSRRGPLYYVGRAIELTRNAYSWSVNEILKFWPVPLVVLAACFGGAVWLFTTMPATFLPDEDQGALFVNVQLPDAASLSRTEEILARITATIDATDGVDQTISVSGFSILQGTLVPNGGMVVAALDPWEERESPELRIDALVGQLNMQFSTIPDAIIGVFAPPAIPGVGIVGGLDVRLQALEGQSPLEMASALAALIGAANQDPSIAGLSSTYSASVPQLYVEVDRLRAERLGLSISDVYDTIGAHFSARYINDFNFGGRVFQVRMSADASYRATAADILALSVRNKQGRMVQIENVITVRDDLGPYTVQRYNLYQAAQVNGLVAPGFSTGVAMDAIRRIASDTLPDGYDVAWSGLTFQESQTSGNELVIFGMALLFAYLFLVALYESWMLPVAIILSLGTAAFGALLAVFLWGMPTSLYVQIGLVLLIGLAAKNAILVVEFAKQRSDEGQSPGEAALNGASARFRAVLMTALSFISGVLPLVLSSGAGAGAQNAIGVTVIGGMIGATVIGLFVIPSLYYAIQLMREWFHDRRGE